MLFCKNIINKIFLLMAVMLSFESQSAHSIECKLSFHEYCNQGKQVKLSESNDINEKISSAIGPKLSALIPDKSDFKVICSSAEWSDEKKAIERIQKIAEKFQEQVLTGFFYGAAAPGTEIIAELKDGTKLIISNIGLFCVIDKESRRWYSKGSG